MKHSQHSQKEFFENGAAAFQGNSRTDHQAEQQRIEFLEIQTKDEVLAELMAEHIALKKVLGSSDQGVGAARCAGPGGGFRPVWVGKDRDRCRTIHPLAGSAGQQVLRLVNEHNGWVPRDIWLAPWEKQAIIGFHWEHPLEGYRRLTFMMLDADVVAVSPSSIWRVLGQAGLLSRWKGKPTENWSAGTNL